MLHALLTFIVLLGLLGDFVSAAESSHYDECILKSMKGVTNNVVAGRIMTACRNISEMRHKKASRTLTIEETRRLTGRASFSGDDSQLFGSIYNGNATLTVYSITFQIATTKNGESRTKLYRKDVTIKPLTVEPFTLAILVGDLKAERSWGISSARGY